MDAAVLHALQKWPDVPACHGWIHLDPRGRWRLGTGKGELVRHPGLAAFLARNYGATESGEWYVQNGPQRAYVCLACAPHVAHLNTADRLVSHTGVELTEITGAFLDANGRLYVVSAVGLASIDDRDLVSLLPHITSVDGLPADDDIILAFITGQPSTVLTFSWDTRQFPIAHLDIDRAEEQFGFVRTPTAQKDQE